MKPLDKHLDDLWRTIIKLRDKGVCQYSLKAKGVFRDGVDAHHIISRTKWGTRWDTRNGILLHAYHNRGVAHKYPEQFRNFILEKWFGSQVEYDSLVARAWMVGRTVDRQLVRLLLMKEISEYVSLDDNWENLSYNRQAAALREIRKEVAYRQTT